MKHHLLTGKYSLVLSIFILSILFFCNFRHNDLPYNLYKLAENNLDKYNFEKNLTNDPVWGSKYCRSCFTDLPRLRAGKIGAQVNQFLNSK